jgi:hypothetical protein
MQAAAGAPVGKADDAQSEQKLADALTGNEERVAQKEIQSADGNEQNRILGAVQGDTGRPPGDRPLSQRTRVS